MWGVCMFDVLGDLALPFVVVVVELSLLLYSCVPSYGLELVELLLVFVACFAGSDVHGSPLLTGLVAGDGANDIKLCLVGWVCVVDKLVDVAGEVPSKVGSPCRLVVALLLVEDSCEIPN